LSPEATPPPETGSPADLIADQSPPIPNLL